MSLTPLSPLTPMESMNKQLAYRAIELAQREGVSDAKVVLLQNMEQNVIVRDGKTDQLQQAMAHSLTLTLYVDGREGFFYTNDLSEDSLPGFVRQSVEFTRLLSPDEARCLPNPSRYYKGGMPDLQNCDPTLGDIPSSEKLRLTSLANAQLVGADPRVISAETRYSDRLHRAFYLATNGLEAEEQSSRVLLTSLVTAQSPDGRHPMDGWGNVRIRFADFPYDDIASIALDRTLRKMGQRPAPTGRYTLLVESSVAFHLLQPIINAMSGAALFQQSSFLRDMLGKPFGSELMDMEDNPHQIGTRGASYFDYDGVATQPRKLFDKGRLQTYFIDTHYGHKLGMAPTTQGLHRLIFTPGARSSSPSAPANSSLFALPSSLQKVGLPLCDGILVTDFNGGNCDPVTGQFSYGIEGFLIQGGEIVHPVSGMNISGQMQQLWQSLSAVGNDADPWETEVVPTLRFDDVAFSGV